ncbi:MAG: class II aldolase/adducin family protein [Glaciecola sp.]|jgi:ribulose-5-phosphate 4-epimerase/fuculose-1-phosphate aldolase|uniref:class II aldolase/adducin family protein n=1 Tax=Glaciecola sp. HTCC2999 TaxID=455436 RepID=UPI0000E0E863|nr:class II aldolase/adducin family protein [Glaciecola sp. HTCC2999]
MTQSVKDIVSPEEWAIRVDLAACYRMVAHYGWDDLIFTHISARVPGPEAHFLINPYGMLFEEVTASSLVKVDLDGNKVLDSDFDINPAGFNIHSAVHAAREDAHCVLHLHTNEGVAVSILEDGLEAFSQASLFPLSGLSYHDYEGVSLDPDEKQRLVADLGDNNFFVLRNHGLLTCASTIPDAFLFMYIMQRAAETQLLAQGTGKPLIKVPDAILAGIQSMAKEVLKSSGGQMAWPGILRKLDRDYPGFRS